MKYTKCNMVKTKLIRYYLIVEFINLSENTIEEQWNFDKIINIFLSTDTHRHLSEVQSTKEI